MIARRSPGFLRHRPILQAECLLALTEGDRKPHVKPSYCTIIHIYRHLSTSILRRHEFPTVFLWISELKVKDKVSNIGNRVKKQGTGVGGGGLDHPVLSLQSEPAIVVEGELRGDIEAGVGKYDLRRDDSRFVSQSAVEIGHGQGGCDNKAYGGETNWNRPHLHPHVQAESGSSQGMRDVDGKGADRADPPPRSDIGNKTTPAPSIFRGGVSEST